MEKSKDGRSVYLRIGFWLEKDGSIHLSGHGVRKDPRFPDTRRYLRQLYSDPMAGSTEWALIKAPQGGIMGVASASEGAPLKRAGFRDPNRVFEDQAMRLKEKMRYRDWEFIYEPAFRPGTVQGAAVRGP